MREGVGERGKSETKIDKRERAREERRERYKEKEKSHGGAILWYEVVFNNIQYFVARKKIYDMILFTIIGAWL